MPFTPRIRSKASRSRLKKVSGPPKYTTFPVISRPWASPAMVWFTTATRMDAAMSFFWAPWFKSAWMSLLANTPHREAML